MSREVMDLSNNRWKMERMRPGQGVAEKIPDIPAERDGLFIAWNDATVPGDVYTDLTLAGEIEDPYFGRNLAKAKWVQDYEWWYVYRFNVEKEFAKKDLKLVLEGVDYACDVWLNHEFLGHHEGMLAPFSFDITGKLNSDVPVSEASECDNMLFIKIEPAPKNLYNVAGFRHVFAGDYLPGFVTVGIWRPVKIIATDKVRIDTTRVETYLKTEDEDCRDVKVNAEVQLEYMRDEPCDVDVMLVLRDEVENVLTKKVPRRLSKGINKVNIEVEIDDAKLWWPWDLGEQHRYDMKVVVCEGDTVLDEKSEKVGLRQVKMAMNPGFTDEEREFPWTFVINNKKTYLRSACWGGQPSLLYGRNSVEKYRHFLTKAKEANLNNLRIFGWHPCETEEFYDICDELGITVWTNFAFSSQTFRTDKEYVDAVLDECEGVVKVRRNHASNIFWMGGEEVYFCLAQSESGNRTLMEKVGRRVNEVTNVPYGDASPLSNNWGRKMGYKPCESHHLNSHYYAGGVITMEDAFKDPNCCIVPELTAASAPCVESLKKCIPEDELWPIGPTWGYLQANIGILKALNTEVFGDARFGSLEEFVDSTQIAQGEIFKFAIERLRRLKPKVSGVSICHFITNRPLVKWEIVDYYGKEKLSFDYVKKAFAPLIPSMEHHRRRFLPNETMKGECYVINDLYTEYEGVTYNYVIKNNEGVVVRCDKKTVDITKNSASKCFEFSYKVQGELGDIFTVELSLVDKDGNVIGANDYTLLVDDPEESKKRCVAAYREHRDNRLKYGRSLYADMKDNMILE